MPNEKDDFWDISSLLPPKKKILAPVFSPKTDVAEISHGEVSEANSRAEQKLTFLGEKKISFTREYIPAWNPLLKHVRVIAYQSNYRIFHVFKNDAVLYSQKKGMCVPFVPFFSYVPQYTQMNHAQIAYYLYFRDELNEGRMHETTQAYLMLYFYEIMNLPEYIPPDLGVLRLANAWMMYRKSFPSIEKYMVAWLADYALIHGVACPNGILSEALGEILSSSNMKEFYLGMEEEFSACILDAFLALASAYDFKNGRYAKGENGALFLTHVRAASKLVLEALLREKDNTATHQTVEKAYDAYIGALCAEEHKYRIEVSYCSVSGTESLKTILTAAVKYAENKVRAYLSIKSRLSVSGLPQKYKDMIDAYFAANLVRAPKKEIELRPEYEALYDAPSIGISEDEARMIENASWENTVRLIPDEEREELFAQNEDEIALSDLPSGDVPQLAVPLVRFLTLFYRNGSDAARGYASANGFLFENACEKINEYFSDTMGDIVIEFDGSDASLIEDYMAEIESFLNTFDGH